MRTAENLESFVTVDVKLIRESIKKEIDRLRKVEQEIDEHNERLYQLLTVDVKAEQSRYGQKVRDVCESLPTLIRQHNLDINYIKQQMEQTGYYPTAVSYVPTDEYEKYCNLSWLKRLFVEKPVHPFRKKLTWKKLPECKQFPEVILSVNVQFPFSENLTSTNRDIVGILGNVKLKDVALCAYPHTTNVKYMCDLQLFNNINSSFPHGYSANSYLSQETYYAQGALRMHVNISVIMKHKTFKNLDSLNNKISELEKIKSKIPEDKDVAHISVDMHKRLRRLSTQLQNG